MGGRVEMGLVWVLALTACLFTAVDPSYADPPEIARTDTYDERGEFFNATLALNDTVSPGIYLTGLGLQNLYQAYAVKLDENSDEVWTRSWGTTYHIYSSMWFNGAGTMIGYTSENSSLDYKMVNFSGEGTLQSTWDFGGNTTADRGYGGIRHGSRYLLVGEVSPGEFGDSDGSMVLVTSTGQVEWSHIYDSASVVRRIVQVDSNSFWLYGTGDSLAGVGTDFWMAEVDSEGTLGASFRFGGARDEELFDAVRVSADLTLLVGSTRSFRDSTQTDIWVVATNDAGDLVFADYYGGNEDDAALTVQNVADRDSGFVIGGYWSEQLLATRNAFLMKFDQNFDSVWAIVRYDTLNSSEFRDVAVDSEFRYHAAGVRNTPIPHGFYMLTVADPAAPVEHPPLPFSLLTPADDALVLVDSIRFSWQATTDPDPGDQVVYALLVDTDSLFDNPVPLTGPLQNPTFLFTSTADVYDRYWQVVAQDQHGNLRICEEGFRHVRKIRPDSTQAFSLLTPDSGSAIPMPTGHFSWEVAVDPDSVDENLFYCLFFQVGDSISLIDTVHGTTANVSFVDHPFIGESDTVTWWVVADSDYPEMQIASRETWTFINWNVPVGPTPLVPSEFSFKPAYPNPFNNEVTLEFVLPNAAEAELVVFDVQGREVIRLASGRHTPGAHAVHWNAAEAASGVYFARLRADGMVATQKLLLLK
ncbi:MAG: T9SS type A sorting domain-containing protein [Calditrichaeota bacterium]|nr:T9SS type A sorting domain-containing protein [Calditrichota bacterium]